MEACCAVTTLMICASLMFPPPPLMGDEGEKRWQAIAACHESVCAGAFFLMKQTPSDSNKELLNTAL